MGLSDNVIPDKSGILHFADSSSEATGPAPGALQTKKLTEHKASEFRQVIDGSASIRCY